MQSRRQAGARRNRLHLRMPPYRAWAATRPRAARVPVIMESALDVQPLLKLFAALSLVDTVGELVDPLFERTLHLVGSCARHREGNRQATGCIAIVLIKKHHSGCVHSTCAAPLGSGKHLFERDSWAPPGDNPIQCMVSTSKLLTNISAGSIAVLVNW